MKKEMANEPNYSRETLLHIVNSWDDAQGLLDYPGDEEYALYRKEIKELGLVPALIWLNTEIVFEKESEREGLESFIDEYGTPWIHLDKEWFFNKFDFISEEEILRSLYVLSGKVLCIRPDENSSFSGFYAKHSDVIRGLAFKELYESEDVENSWRSVMNKYYPEVYADMEETKNV